jgi:predicted DsbA family dithiol-disulfide isomerase
MILDMHTRRRKMSPSMGLALLALGISVVLCFPTLAATTSSHAQWMSLASAGVRRSRLSLAGIPQNNRTLGYERAPVVLVVLEDPQCPVCLRWHTAVLPDLVRKYVRTGKLQIRWHGFAVIGPASLTGEELVLAAGLQNHLWDMIDDIMANQGTENGGWLNDSLAERIGHVIPGFNISAEMADLHSRAVIDEVNGDQRRGTRVGLEGVPFFELGRRGGPIRPLDFHEFEPRQFEGPINRLLRHR